MQRIDADLLKFLAVDWNGTVVPFFGRSPYTDALEVLCQWRQRGVEIHIVSHAPQATIVADVERVGLQTDGIVGCQDKAPPFRDLRQRLGIGLVLGDHPADLRAAKKAGLPFLQACLEGQSVLPGNCGVFESWQEVPLLVNA